MAEPTPVRWTWTKRLIQPNFPLGLDEQAVAYAQEAERAILRHMDSDRADALAMAMAGMENARALTTYRDLSMDATAWEQCDEPQPMVQTISGPGAIPLTDRKLRLIACACWRAFNQMPGTDYNSTLAVALPIAEEWAEEPPEHHGLGRRKADYLVKTLAGEQRPHVIHNNASQALQGTVAQILSQSDKPFGSAATLCETIRAVAGNPFEPPRWNGEFLLYLHWHDGMIPKMAKTIYTDKAWDQMPALGDAFQEAGCPNEIVGPYACETRNTHDKHDDQCPRLLLPHPILAHFYGVCRPCGGVGTRIHFSHRRMGQERFEPGRLSLDALQGKIQGPDYWHVVCGFCEGTGRRKIHHFLGDWLLDAILNKQ